MSKKSICIVGAGPSGSALATLCARAGHRVQLFDQHASTQRVVGESLLPFGNRVLELLGVDMSGFVVKRGAIFTLGDEVLRFDFSHAENPRWTSAHQVDRSVFDERLRTLALEAGAKIDFEKITEAPTGYDWVVDATGRCRQLGRKWTKYRAHPQLKNAAVSYRYEGVVLPDSALEGDIAICRIEGAWFWIIPLSGSLMSVGLVTCPERKGLKWDVAVSECSLVRDALSNASRIEGRRGHRDFTEYADSFVGDGWALVGDTAQFLDPVFSSGVLLALESAERLSRVIDGRLSATDYEGQMRAAGQRIEALILGFYNGDFFDLGFAPPDKKVQAFVQGTVSLLAGDVFEGGSRMARVVSRQLPHLAQKLRTER